MSRLPAASPLDMPRSPSTISFCSIPTRWCPSPNASFRARGGTRRRLAQSTVRIQLAAFDHTAVRRLFRDYRGCVGLRGGGHAPRIDVSAAASAARCVSASRSVAGHRRRFAPAHGIGRAGRRNREFQLLLVSDLDSPELTHLSRAVSMPLARQLDLSKMAPSGTIAALTTGPRIR